MSLHGAAGFLEQPGGRAGWRDGLGGWVERIWEGPSALLGAFLTSTLPPGYSDYARDLDGEIVTVRAIYPVGAADGVGDAETDGTVSDDWELDGNDLEKSLWQKPSVVAAFDSLTSEEAAIARRVIEDLLSGEGTAYPANVELGLLATRLVAGVEAWPVSQYVLRRTVTVRRNTSLSAIHTNVNRVFDYTGITAAEPSLAADGVIAASDLTHLHWLKRTPRVGNASKGLRLIVYEYWGAEEWDDWIHDPST